MLILMSKYLRTKIHKQYAEPSLMLYRAFGITYKCTNLPFSALNRCKALTHWIHFYDKNIFQTSDWAQIFSHRM